jgi:hypothetical protein
LLTNEVQKKLFPYMIKFFFFTNYYNWI